MMKNLQHENVWITKPFYDEAETKYYESQAKSSLTPLAEEVAKARQRLIESRDNFKEVTDACAVSIDVGAIKFLEKKVVDFEKTFAEIVKRLSLIESRLDCIDKNAAQVKSQQSQQPVQQQTKGTSAQTKKDAAEDDDDDVDLFGTDSEEDEAVDKIKEERLAAYNAKKSKKPALIAKSNVILDVKPWDDETDMKKMEEEVRKIETDGLLWGVAKLVPLAYGIHKLQISSVVEDEKVSIDWLTEQIESIEDYVQSVDIAAFNKI